ncbi:C39 family peptidase [Candidatus Micrarchaeota archaeon]|nr:C39 family peptidase [Candidatus Micrarchaeota archaeon]MBU1930500.1 C39 family peptidase [Candidatus Micrarchaeota archaeon]
MKRYSVPTLKQVKLNCGITALQMVLQYFNKDIPSSEITKQIGGIKKFGVRTIKLAEFAKSLGFKVTCYSYNKKLACGKATIKKPDKKDIQKFLKKKIPVILAVRAFILYNQKPSKMGHFIVITKYKKGKYWYNDPKDGKKHQIKESDLLFTWHNNILESSGYLLAIEPKKHI